MMQKFQKLLRKDQTHAENFLWHRLRDRRFEGFKFRRQHIVQGYIVDFICLEKQLIIELDGGQHATQQAYDHKRTQAFQKEEFRVLRFWNNDVLNNIESVWNIIYNTINTPHPPQAATSPTRGEVASSSSAVEVVSSSSAREVISSRITSPLVGEVAPRAGEG